MKKGTWMKRMAAVLLALTVLAVSIPAFVIPTAASKEDGRVADPSTLDEWKSYFGDEVLSTKYAGGVWTDKSVLTDASAFEGTGISMSKDGDNFLIALSAIASNTSLKGLSNIPTDVMLVLDLSDSVYRGAQKDPETVKAMMQTVNQTMTQLQALNRFNRVGVVVYYGGEAYQPSSVDAAAVLLPLGRYVCTDDSFLKTTVSGGKLVSVEVNSGVTDENGVAVSGKYTVPDAAGAYTQLGILKAMNEFLNADPILPQTAGQFAGKTRIPVMVLVSGGEPTAATPQFTTETTAGMGNNSASIRNPAQTDFVTQLTASYAKERIDEHYKATDALFYTLYAGGEISSNVMDPYRSDSLSTAVLQNPADYTSEQVEAAQVNRAVDAYWNILVNDGTVDITVQNRKDHTVVDQTYTISKATLNVQGLESVFPTMKSQKYYVDEAFSADNAAAIFEAFDAILHKIDLKSHYYPTLVEDGEDISGYITFQDQIGDHMSITEIKGILIDNTLYSGAMLSRNFVTGGGELGTFDTPTSLGDELVWAVQARLGVDVNTARDLLGLAYYHGQLSYKNDTEFSNYIGWYANEAGEFLGFWYEGMTTMPDPQTPGLTDKTRPAYIIRSYGFLGSVDEAHGVVQSDMMYATVQIREHIESGTEEMLFSVPASLIPTVTYEVDLDEQGEMESFAVSGAKHPIRLVYEVALDEGIDALTVHEWINSGAVTQNADGTVNFYTNAFESDHAIGYGTVNSRIYFMPSYQNERYYYTEDSVIYSDRNGTLYEGEKPDPQAALYRAFKVYGMERGKPIITTVYERISPLSLGKAVLHEDGCWYIPANTPHTMLENFVVNKTDNVTQTLPFVRLPFVDTKYDYYVGATLGNNGRLTILPETGIVLQSITTDGETKAQFDFTITRTDAADNGIYQAVLKAADGTVSDCTVAFRNRVARVTIGSGDKLFIIGMAVGASYTVTEQSHPEYKLIAVNGKADTSSAELVTEHGILLHADFKNAPKGVGNVTIVNRVTHDFGASFEIPEKPFTILVDLPDEYADTTIQAEHSEDPALTSVKTDENGDFTITLCHADRFELFGLKEGTVVEVTEVDVPEGFTPAYNSDGVLGTSRVTVCNNRSVSVIITNDYRYEEVDEVNIAVGGSVCLLGREDGVWTDSDVYSFQLQRYENGDWVSVASATADKEHPYYDFTDVMNAQRFTKSGIYNYQIVEIPGGVPGVSYDRTVHTFSVVIGDEGMCGHLHVMNVIPYHDGDIVSGNEQNGWTFTADFTNLYTAGNRADAVIDIGKVLVNAAGSDRVTLAGYRFGLFADGETLPAFVSDLSDGVGEARLIASFEEDGVYTYTLRELVPDEAINGLRYSDESYTVVVEVTKGTDGIRRASARVSSNGQELSIPVTFTNVYAPKAATLLPQVNVVLDGRDLRDGEFAFRILEGEAVLTDGVNTESGNVVFDRELSFDIIGDYYYDVIQTVGDVKGITYDKQVYKLHITVTDGGDGALQAHYHVVNTVVDIVTFVNDYEAASARVIVSGIKQLDGRDLINEEFQFVLLDADNPRNQILSASNFTDGTFRFEPISFYETGYHHYTVYEVHESTTYGIEFDDSKYDVYVTVCDDGSGELRTDTVIYKDNEIVDDIVFVNHYITTHATVTLDGAMVLEGRVLMPEEFCFELYKANEAWETDATLDTACNDENGMFAFDELVFDEAGVYRFLIREKNGGETVDGITYDGNVYRVMVVVTDNHRGTLSATKTILDQTNEYVDNPLFVNRYSSTPTPPTTITTTTTSTTTSVTASAASTTAVGTTAPQTPSPETGVSSETALWLVLLFFSGGVIVTLVRNKKQA